MGMLNAVLCLTAEFLLVASTIVDPLNFHKLVLPCIADMPLQNDVCVIIPHHIIHCDPSEILCVCVL